MARFGDLDTQYFDASGDPLASGKIYFYESGTTTPKTTFADINSSIPNTNPVILDAAGRQPNIFFEGVAKAVLTNNGDTQIVARDPVGETATNFGDEWVSTRIYGSNDVVIASDGQYYRSLLAGNQNNNPVTTAGFWTLLYSVEWNSGISYAVGSTVTYDLIQYQSLQSTNLNHQPDTSPTFWVSLEFAWLSTATYVEDQNVVGTDGILYTSLQNANTGNDPATSPAYWVGTSAAAAASAVAAASSATDAQTAQTAAELAETNAETAQTAAETAQTAAELAETNAETAETNAETAQTAAETAQTAAELAQTNAETAETNAETAETNAAASASAASTSETNAATSATNSATSATASAASATASASSATDAQTAQTAAELAETNAATSETNAATSASNASTSESNASSSASAASTSATNAATSATNAATAETGAEAALDEFTDIYLGAFASDPTTDNDGDPLAAGMLYYNTTADVLRVYSGTAWQDAGSAVNGTSSRATYTATSGQTTFAIVYDVGFVDVYLNGVKLIAGTDYTATNGTSIVLTVGATLNDLVDIIAFGTFSVANALTAGNNLSDVSSATTAVSNLGFTVTAAELNAFNTVPAVGTQTGSYTLVTSDTGKYVQVGTGGSITVPDATFSEGDVVNIFNNTTGDITITCSITTAYISGTDTDVASVTLATRGLCTIFFISGTVCVIAGAVS